MVSEAGRPAPHGICHRNVGFLSHLAVRNGACRAGGVFLLDLVCRKVGEKGLKRLVKPRLLDYLKGQMQNHAAVALVISCLAPPPFPFGASIATASAFQYPRMHLLVLVFVARAFRYSLVGWAAIYFGRRILRIADSAEFMWFMAGFITLCLIGSTVSIIHWVRVGRSR